MEMMSRQFAPSMAAAATLRSSLSEPLSPFGVSRRVVPGRVTWAHDPAAVWDGTGSGWTDAHNDQSAIDRMVSRSLLGLTNQKSDTQAPHRKWEMAPFNDAWPNSIFMSIDGVAIDSVGSAFLTSEWADLPDIANGDNYSREAALANDPPSKTLYDPERDGIRCRSLGAHEHWNNGTDKKYLRNLGKAQGIELFWVS
jgi:hypothetical protein